MQQDPQPCNINTRTAAIVVVKEAVTRVVSLLERRGRDGIGYIRMIAYAKQQIPKIKPAFEHHGNRHSYYP